MSREDEFIKKIIQIIGGAIGLLALASCDNAEKMKEPNYNLMDIQVEKQDLDSLKEMGTITRDDISVGIRKHNTLIDKFEPHTHLGSYA